MIRVTSARVDGPSPAPTSATGTVMVGSPEWLKVAKGAAMKFGQMLSVIEPDLVPESHRERFCDNLTRLRNQAPAIEFAEMRRVLENDLGSLSRAFTDFDELPVAAACVKPTINTA